MTNFLTKGFEWMAVRFEGGAETLSFLEIVDGGDRRMFWASIRLTPTDDGDYEFVAYPKDRRGLVKSVPNALTVDEAKEAIVEFLMDEGVIPLEHIVNEY